MKYYREGNSPNPCGCASLPSKYLGHSRMPCAHRETILASMTGLAPVPVRKGRPKTKKQRKEAAR